MAKDEPAEIDFVAVTEEPHPSLGFMFFFFKTTYPFATEWVRLDGEYDVTVGAFAGSSPSKQTYRVEADASTGQLSVHKIGKRRNSG